MPLNPDTDALIVVDMQLDFCPGGPLAVPGADEVVPLINKLAAGFPHVIVTQDWHPAGHISFASSHPGKAVYDVAEAPYGPQTLWPDHCVQGTPGAALHPGLRLPHAELILRKGYRCDMDSYSAFFEADGVTPTGLAGYLRERGLTRLYLAGLATDFCVGWSAQGARQQGFGAVVLEDATRAIDLNGSLGVAWAAMTACGVERGASSGL